MIDITFPYKVPVLKVSQPMGDFFAASLPAQLILDVADSEPARVQKNRTVGTQRSLNEDRAKSIAKFVDSVDAAFPNSVILGANYDFATGALLKAEEKHWTVEKTDGSSNLYILTIPTRERLVSLIDGQHRVESFRYVNSEERRDMDLLCAIYIDLPLPFHAYVFATINFNQKKVDKAVAYQLFGYGYDKVPSEKMPPETLAVLLARALEADASTPFYQHIKLGIPTVEEYAPITSGEWVDAQWKVSLASIVDGIQSLVSTQPMKDRDDMREASLFSDHSRKVLRKKNRRDLSPLRELYLDLNDKAIYTVLINFFEVIDEVFWKLAESRNEEKSFIVRTVGIQALFHVLKKILQDNIANGKVIGKENTSVDYFRSLFSGARKIQFSDPYFTESSAKGRSKIQNALLVVIGLKDIQALGIQQGGLEEVFKKYA